MLENGTKAEILLVYHTQSEEWVINRILDLKGKTEDYFDKNKSIKKLLMEN